MLQVTSLWSIIRSVIQPNLNAVINSSNLKQWLCSFRNEYMTEQPTDDALAGKERNMRASSAFYSSSNTTVIISYFIIRGTSHPSRMLFSHLFSSTLRVLLAYIHPGVMEMTQQSNLSFNCPIQLIQLFFATECSRVQRPKPALYCRGNTATVSWNCENDNPRVLSLCLGWRIRTVTVCARFQRRVESCFTAKTAYTWTLGWRHHIA